MDADTIAKLDKMEQKLLESLERWVQSGSYVDAEKASRVLVNIATYRKLAAGDKMRGRPDGTADLSGAAR